MSICKGDEVCYCPRCKRKTTPIRKHRWILTTDRGIRCAYCDRPTSAALINMPCNVEVTYAVR